MLLIYDDVSGPRGRASLFADAIFSVLRQRLFRDGANNSTSPLREAGVSFAAIDTSRPSLLILAHGCAATVVAWFGLSLLMEPGKGDQKARLEFAGAHHLVDSRLSPPRVQIRASGPSSRQLPRAEYSQPSLSEFGGRAAPTLWSRVFSAIGITSAPEVMSRPGIHGLNTQPVLEGSPRVQQQRPVLSPPRMSAGLFAADPLLLSIDRDLDSRLSASEIARAPGALLSFDRNHDGSLTVEECGLKGGSVSEWKFTSLFAVLDRDGDGKLSAMEVANAGTVLSSLDRNHDGWVSRAEIRVR
jgi:Ca2+-binding EF-hand superfamily protein